MGDKEYWKLVGKGKAISFITNPINRQYRSKARFGNPSELRNMCKEVILPNDRRILNVLDNQKYQYDDMQIMYIDESKKVKATEAFIDGCVEGLNELD